MTYRPYYLIINEAIATGSNSVVTLLNNSGSILSAFSPVTLDVNGNIKLIDVSVELDALNAVGVVTASTLNNTQTNVVRLGKIENVNSLGFALRDTVYVSKTGVLTNVAPAIGVNGFQVGDFVIKIGQISKNQTVTINKDLLISVQLIGQL